MLITRWQDLDWKFIQQTVFKWQQEIYLASKNGDIRLVRLVQHRLLYSIQAKLLAVRRVTQDNKGKATPGIDGISQIPPIDRILLARQLKIPTKPKALRRIWIPKPGTADTRPLGIPTIHDRCLQALMKLAMEPEWEARFESNSYGFRPGRNCHDAIRATLDCVRQKPKYVLDADLSKCFDRINQKALLIKIGFTGAYSKQLKYWLKSGILENGVLNDTTQGTPQGGVISPLLANIALHGLEIYLKKWISTLKEEVVGKDGKIGYRTRSKASLHLIRYADDFIILHREKSIILACRKKVSEFLSEIYSLELLETKTRLTHTLELKPDDTPSEGFDGKTGFEFLGFTIKQYKTKHRSAKSSQGEKLGFKTLIFPSPKSEMKYRRKLHLVIFNLGLRYTQKTLILKLNPVIRGWASYFGVSHANTTSHLVKLDHLIHLMLRKWTQRRSKTSALMRAARYWKNIGGRKWTFSTGETTLLLNRDYSNPISNYVKVIATRSPFDENQLYWAQRMISNPIHNNRTRALLKTQRCRCTVCGLQFQEGDVLEVDHIIPRHSKGLDQYINLQLLHRHCHHAKTALDSKPTRLPRPPKRSSPPNSKFLKKRFE